MPVVLAKSVLVGSYDHPTLGKAHHLLGFLIHQQYYKGFLTPFHVVGLSSTMQSTWILLHRAMSHPGFLVPKPIGNRFAYLSP